MKQTVNQTKVVWDLTKSDNTVIRSIQSWQVQTPWLLEENERYKMKSTSKLPKQFMSSEMDLFYIRSLHISIRKPPHYYHPPMKLREGNVFIHVCQSMQWESHETWYYKSGSCILMRWIDGLDRGDGSGSVYLRDTLTPSLQ